MIYFLSLIYMRNIDSFAFGDIVLLDYEFTDGSWSKLRPVLVLFIEWEDITVLKMTTQEKDQKDALKIEPNNQNRLKASTYICMKKISTFHETLFLSRKLWAINPTEKFHIKKYVSEMIENL